MNYRKQENPWTPEDEGDHYPVMKEWWTVETLFTTEEDNRKWNLLASFSYKLSTRSCFFQYVLFDITSKKCVSNREEDNSLDKLHRTKNKIDLKYGSSFLTGTYPNYHVHIENKEKDIIADIQYDADSLPHWIAQDKTNGYLPIGLNNYRYGFLPNCKLSGTLNFKGVKYKINGTGYLEHAYGNWSYQNPFHKISGLKKTLSIYAKLGGWWLSQNKVRIPKRIGFSTENNIYGYDWIWGIFDNNWSLFFGNSMFWINEGPSFGALYLTQNGRDYLEFCNVRFRYNKLIYVEKYDFYYPSEIELKAIFDKYTINLRFWKTTESYEYIDPYMDRGMFKAWVLCEMPGKMKGNFTDGEKSIELSGNCKIVPLRIPSAYGHNEIKLEFIRPPQGVGINMNVDSHYFMKKINAKIHLAPRPSFKFKLEKIKKDDFKKNVTSKS